LRTRVPRNLTALDDRPRGRSLDGVLPSKFSVARVAAFVLVGALFVVRFVA